MDKTKLAIFGCIWLLFFTVAILLDIVREMGYEPIDYAMDNIFPLILAAICFITAIFTKESN